MRGVTIPFDPQAWGGVSPNVSEVFVRIKRATSSNDKNEIHVGTGECPCLVWEMGMHVRVD